MKVLTLLLSFCAYAALGQNLSQEQQISDAVLALDEGDRTDASVMGYDAAGEFKTLKTGSNNLICLTDDPNKEGFSVACYHKNLDPFMARGRALKKEGKDRGQVEKIREEEAKSGKLKMPEKASTLYVLSGDTKEDASLRWVVYIPWATAETTGLPIRPMSAGAPWIMFPGSYRAHIMITPAQ
ncbi:hypothetical protein [Arcticibacterium luteifluviistationis]|uniref:Uncharacterized protein n=1 Tax=Arcticibacterium luteifluviistationis TaxID=1784714 RepID=A0A2Z4GAE0_9BACT|nr:hypothetical protein [Arcticibacterium luteifluviistationis]AWV98060.1 hypothetical protein DJ013_07695 [Arcticibacterium luteifluviistationis]